MNAAVNRAVAAALKEQPQIPSNLINVAGRWCKRPWEMSKESALYFMFLYRLGTVTTYVKVILVQLAKWCEIKFVYYGEAT